MQPPALRRQAPYEPLQRIGIPQALLYHRYGQLWTEFFRAIDRTPVISAPTDRHTVERDGALSNDECCFASKIYLGHVESLIGSCDGIFVPCIDNLGHFKSFCTKFQALPDMVANTFVEQSPIIVSCQVNETIEHIGMRDAFLDLAAQFAYTPREAKHAWKQALHAQQQKEAADAAQQRQLLQNAPGNGITVLLAAHPYLAHDPYMCGAFSDMLANMGVTPLYADRYDRKRAPQSSFQFSDTLPWIVNRKIVGSIMNLHDSVDGILLVSAFPCGPDSMTDDAIIRRIKGKPVLSLTVDAQTDTAGLETRIESFIDVLRYQKRGGYVHAANRRQRRYYSRPASGKSFHGTPCYRRSKAYRRRPSRTRGHKRPKRPVQAAPRAQSHEARPARPHPRFVLPLWLLRHRVQVLRRARARRRLRQLAPHRQNAPLNWAASIRATLFARRSSTSLATISKTLSLEQTCWCNSPAHAALVITAS